MYQGNKTRAQAFLDLDGNSGWSVRQEMQSALRQKDDSFALALAIIATEGGYKDAEIIVAHLEHKPAADVEKVAAREEADAMKEIDPEEKYEVAAMLSSAGDTDRAMHVLKAAIQSGHCALPLLDIDPLLGALRSRSDFQQLRLLSTQCQQNFLAHIGG